MPKIPFWIFIVLAILYFSSARIDVMDVDAAQYAEMSREMMETGSYLQIYDRGKDYLDKPPLLFWVSAASMKIFGVNNFGFKFPSIVFALWALFATFRLTKLLYDEKTGRMAALILGACQGMFLMTNDIRTDTILMSCTITAVWLIKEWEINRKLHFLLSGVAAIAFGMMAKGPVALMIPVFCFVSDWALKRKWKLFFKLQYFLALLVITVLLIPMSIGLYQQFDMHPEKVIDGKTGTSGLKFFFWTQSFGRITGENIWSNGAPFSFLYENMLWSFLPWIILFTLALILKVVLVFRQKFYLKQHEEWISAGGFLLAYLALGSSNYQLPHYIFIVFPLASIMVASLIKDFTEGKYPLIYKVMKPVQTVISFLLLVAAMLSFAFIFPGTFWLWLIWIAGLGIWLWLMFIRKICGRILWSGAAAVIIANIFMTHHFYYELLKFQAGSQVGKLIHKKSIPAEQIRIVDLDDPFDAGHFYAQGVIRRTDSFPEIKGVRYFITGRDCIMDLRENDVEYKILKEGNFFKVSELTPEFLNPATREKALKHYYLIKIMGRGKIEGLDSEL